MYNDFNTLNSELKINDIIILITIISIMIMPLLIYIIYKIKIEIKSRYKLATEKRIEELKKEKKDH